MVQSRIPLLLVLYFTLVVGHSQGFTVDAKQLKLSYFESVRAWGSGVSAADFDNDGDVDMYVSTSAEYPNGLLVNDGTGRYDAVDLGASLYANSRASVWADLNGDKRLDLLLVGDDYETESPISRHWFILLQNEEGRFEDATESSGIIGSDPWVDGAIGGVSVGDLNMDGYLDIVIVYYTGNITRSNPRKGANRVLLNDGSGFFNDITASLSANLTGTYWNPLIFDLDGNGFPEIYINQDHELPNLYFENAGDGLFLEKAAERGMDAAQYDMGSSIADIDNDGDLDIHITSIKYASALTGNFLLRNNSEGGIFGYTRIVNETKESGWAWGTTVQDFNNDGHQDIACTNGSSGSPFSVDPSKFWRNHGGWDFSDISSEVGFDDTYVGTSLISFDADRDGDLDLIQTIRSEYHPAVLPIRYLRNDLSNALNYLVIKPRMHGTNYWAIGATVKIRMGNNVSVRAITAGTGFYSQEPAEAHFGLGEFDFVDEVTVIWPGGAMTTIRDVAPNQVLEITDEDALHRPGQLTARVQANSIYLDWKDMSVVTEGFIIERSDRVDFSDFVVIASELTGTSFLDQNLAGYTTYYYRVRAQAGEEVSGPSFMVQATTDDEEIVAPSDLTVSRREVNLAHLTWRDNSTNELGFRLVRSLSESFESSFEIELPANSVDYVDEALEPGFTYFYKVRAERTGSVSDFSEVAGTDYLLETKSQSAPFDVYPTITDSFLRISLPDGESCRLEILSLAGTLIDDWSEDSSHSKEIEAKPGLYILKMTNSKGAFSRKILIRP